MSKLYKPEYKKKYHRRRALILKSKEYEKQYRYGRKRAILYQSKMLHTHGPEMMFLFSWEALFVTVDEWNSTYGDNMDFKHAALLVMVKHFSTMRQRPDFLVGDFMGYYPRIKNIVGYFFNRRSRIGQLLMDLHAMHFLNSHKRDQYITTTRLKIFIAMLGKNVKAMYDDAQEQNSIQ